MNAQAYKDVLTRNGLFPGVVSFNDGVAGVLSWEVEPTSEQLATVDALLASVQVAQFMGEDVYDRHGVDLLVSKGAKEIIAPGKPPELQTEAEHALLAKTSAINTLVTLGQPVSADDIAFLQAAMGLWAQIAALRDAGNEFIATHGW